MTRILSAALLALFWFCATALAGSLGFIFVALVLNGPTSPHALAALIPLFASAIASVVVWGWYEETKEI